MPNTLNRENDGQRLRAVEVRADFTEQAMRRIEESLDKILDKLDALEAEVHDMKSKVKGGWWMLCALGTVTVGMSAAVSHLLSLAR